MTMVSKESQTLYGFCDHCGNVKLRREANEPVVIIILNNDDDDT